MALRHAMLTPSCVYLDKPTPSVVLVKYSYRLTEHLKTKEYAIRSLPLVSLVEGIPRLYSRAPGLSGMYNTSYLVGLF